MWMIAKVFKYGNCKRTLKKKLIKSKKKNVKNFFNNYLKIYPPPPLAKTKKTLTCLYIPHLKWNGLWKRKENI